MNKSTKSPSEWKRVDYIILFLCLLASFSICWYFHDKGWYAADDGFYGFVSQRILAGDVIHRDFQVLHPGLTYLVNTIALHFSGGDLVGLRYPLIATTVIQTGLGYCIARKNGQFAAIAAALALTAFGFLQFINPTGNWYALCLAVFLVYLLDRKDRYHWKYIAFLGFVVGVIFLFRQYSGAITAIAVTVSIFLINSGNKSEKKEVEEKKYTAGRNLLIFLTLGMCAFLSSSGHITGFLLVGFWSILIMAISVTRVNTDLKDTSIIVGALFLGAILSAIPIVSYHLYYGSLVNWITDLTVANYTLSNMAVHDLYYYGTAPIFAFISFLKGDLPSLGGAIFWTSLLLAPTTLGFLTVRKIYNDIDSVPVVSLFACIFAIVSIVFEAPIYLVYSTGLVFLALITGETHSQNNKVLISTTLLSVTAIVFQAGEFKQETRYTAINKRQSVATHILPNTSIKVSAKESEKYSRLINLVETCTRTDDEIYAFPISPQINFLTKRDYPFRYFILLLGLQTDQAVQNQIDQVLGSTSLALILHDSGDQYFNSEKGQNFLDGVEKAFTYLGKVDEYSIYSRTDHEYFLACSNLEFDPIEVMTPEKRISNAN